MFRFKCTCCNAWHEGMPTFATDAPLYLYAIPEGEREHRCVLQSDTCVIDDRLFFVRGCIEIPVNGTSEPFIWGVWVSLSAQSFDDFVGCFDTPKRAHIGPFFGWLSAELPLYPSTENLKTRVHLRDDGVRPYIELEPTDHPLAVEQRIMNTVNNRCATVHRIPADDPRKNKNAASPKGSGVLFDRDT